MRDTHRRLIEGLLETAFGDLALGNVLDHGDQIDNLSRLVADDAGRAPGPQHAAVLAQEPLLVGEDVGAGALPGLAAETRAPAVIVGMGDFLDVPADQLLARIAEHLAEALVDFDHDAVGIGARDADGRVIEHFAHPPLALAQPLLRVRVGDARAQMTDAVGDVAGEIGEEHYFLLVECVGFPRVDRDRAEDFAVGLERQRDRGLETMLQRARPAAGKLRIVQDVAGDMRLARLDDLGHEALITAVRAPCHRRGHRRVLAVAGMRDGADRAPVGAGGIAHPGHLVTAGIDHNAAHALQHPRLVIGMDQDVTALRHHAPRAGLAGEPRLGALALRDVLDDLDQVARAVRTAGERHGAVDPQRRAVLAHVALLGRKGTAAPRDQLPAQRVLPVAVVGVRQIARGQRPQLGRGVAQHPAQPAVDLQERALGRGVRQTDGRLLESRAKPALDLAQRVAGAAARLLAPGARARSHYPVFLRPSGHFSSARAVPG